MSVNDLATRWLTRAVPRAKDRRTLAIGLATVGTLLVLGRGLPAWRRWEADARSAAVASANQLEVMQSAITTQQGTRRTALALRRQLDSLSDVYPSASSATVAGAELATFISDLGDESGVRVGSASVKPDTIVRSTFARVAVRISATGDAEGLAEYLRAIESSPQLLAVRELSVSQSDPGAPDSRAEALHFELLVEGLVRVIPKPIKQ